MWPLEFTATPGTSPKFMPGGSLKKSGTESKEISGTVCWAKDSGASKTSIAKSVVFIVGISAFESTPAQEIIARRKYPDETSAASYGFDDGFPAHRCGRNAHGHVCRP